MEKSEILQKISEIIDQSLIISEKKYLIDIDVKIETRPRPDVIMTLEFEDTID